MADECTLGIPFIQLHLYLKHLHLAGTPFIHLHNNGPKRQEHGKWDDLLIDCTYS